MAERIKVGQIVKSHAGHDAGRIYVVVGIPAPAVVLVADGRDRGVGKPKKKNIRHISVLDSLDKGVAAKVTSGNKVTDEDIRAAINAWIGTGEQ
ncbi:MAG TPA: KOW domain-containing RNA-binding protein [Selenomonadales bacterium]|nr:KOW domain-containing RNA-binding protein [Selenomonadales bacterium]